MVRGAFQKFYSIVIFTVLFSCVVVANGLPCCAYSRPSRLLSLDFTFVYLCFLQFTFLSIQAHIALKIEVGLPRHTNVGCRVVVFSFASCSGISADIICCDSLHCFSLLSQESSKAYLKISRVFLPYSILKPLYTVG